MIFKRGSLFFYLVFLINANSLHIYSQPFDFFEGKVFNSVSSKPVPFATVKLKNNQIGVYANADGDFRISRNSLFQTDSLIITCIGFKRTSLAYNDLSSIRVNIVNLEPAVYSLGEIKVTASKRNLSSLAIIGRAIRQIRNNYPARPYSYISYYRDYQKKNGNYINLNEAIIQTLENGFRHSSAINKYRLLDFRENIDFPRIAISPYYNKLDAPDFNYSDKFIPNATIGDQYGNELFILMVHDAIRNYDTKSFSFIDVFSEDFLRNHRFSDPVQVFNNNTLLYKISFTSNFNITGDSILVSGAIYIRPKDFSIHKLEYNCSYLLKDKTEKEMYNIDTEYGYEGAIDSLMCLKYISFNNIFNVVDTTDQTYFRVLDSYWDARETSPRTLILDFSNKVDPISAKQRRNYEIIVGGKEARILFIEVRGTQLILKIKDEKFPGLKGKTVVNVHNLKDIDGNTVNQRKGTEYYQFRELFVQSYNRQISFTNNCYIGYSPLIQNCISRYDGNENYWMNTPQNIQSVK
jgi:hypothetical protein